MYCKIIKAKSKDLFIIYNLTAPERGQLIKGNTMEHQLTYMDIKRKEQRKTDFNENIKGIVGALALFALYAIVSTMDYQDCLRGASC